MALFVSMVYALLAFKGQVEDYVLFAMLLLACVCVLVCFPVAVIKHREN